MTPATRFPRLSTVPILGAGVLGLDQVILVEAAGLAFGFLTPPGRVLDLVCLGSPYFRKHPSDVEK